MNKLGVIAFCGSKFSGKSTSATVFKEIIGAPTEEIAIAGHLKEVCAKVFKIDYDSFIDPDKKEVEMEEYVVLGSQQLQALLKEFFVESFDYNTHVRPHIGRVLKTPRTLLQYIGTEVLHPLDPLIHVKVALKKKDPNKLTVITDLRFVAEFDYFDGTPGFVPVYVKNAAAELAASVDAHPSERQLHSFKHKCYLLDNEAKSLNTLKSGLYTLIEKVYK